MVCHGRCPGLGREGDRQTKVGGGQRPAAVTRRSSPGSRDALRRDDLRLRTRERLEGEKGYVPGVETNPRYFLGKKTEPTFMGTRGHKSEKVKKNRAAPLRGYAKIKLLQSGAGTSRVVREPLNPGNSIPGGGGRGPRHHHHISRVPNSGSNFPGIGAGVGLTPLPDLLSHTALAGSQNFGRSAEILGKKGGPKNCPEFVIV